MSHDLYFSKSSESRGPQGGTKIGPGVSSAIVVVAHDTRENAMNAPRRPLLGCMFVSFELRFCKRGRRSLVQALQRRQRSFTREQDPPARRQHDSFTCLPR